ncbi:MAG: hypothetical protein ABIG91_02315 [Patescibacteria group bacterium]
MNRHAVITFMANVRKANFCDSPAGTLCFLMNQAQDLKLTFFYLDWRRLLTLIGVSPKDILMSNTTFIPNSRLPAVEKYRGFIKWLEEEEQT